MDESGRNVFLCNDSVSYLNKIIKLVNVCSKSGKFDLATVINEVNCRQDSISLVISIQVLVTLNNHPCSDVLFTLFRK